MPSTLIADFSRHASVGPIINASETGFADFALPPGTSLCDKLDRSDESLIRQIFHRRPDALCLLYERYEAFVIAIARKVLIDPDDAQETQQDVFLLIWNHAERFDARRGTVKGWIGGLTHCRAIDRCRKRRREAAAREKVQEELARNMTERLDPPENTAYFSEVGDDGRAVLREAVACLPPEQMQVLLLTYMSGMSQREMAAHLGLTLGVAKHRLTKAMRAMTKKAKCLRQTLVG